VSLLLVIPSLFLFPYFPSLNGTSETNTHKREYSYDFQYMQLDYYFILFYSMDTMVLFFDGYLFSFSLSPILIFLSRTSIPIFIWFLQAC
jgi:hypothetical protein